MHLADELWLRLMQPWWSVGCDRGRRTTPGMMENKGKGLSCFWALEILVDVIYATVTAWRVQVQSKDGSTGCGITKNAGWRRRGSGNEGG